MGPGNAGVACEVADRVAVMYAGRFIETGPVEAIIARPAHPFTNGLLRSTVHQHARGVPLLPIPDALPDLPPGCSSRLRCPRPVGAGRVVRCFNPVGADAGARVIARR